MRKALKDEGTDIVEQLSELLTDTVGSAHPNPWSKHYTEGQKQNLTGCILS